MHTYLYICVYLYTYTYIYIHVHIHIYIRCTSSTRWARLCTRRGTKPGTWYLFFRSLVFFSCFSFLFLLFFFFSFCFFVFVFLFSPFSVYFLVASCVDVLRFRVSVLFLCDFSPSLVALVYMYVYIILHIHVCLYTYLSINSCCVCVCVCVHT